MSYLIRASDSKILIVFGTGANKLLAFVASNLFRQVMWYSGGILLLTPPSVTKGF